MSDDVNICDLDELDAARARVEQLEALVRKTREALAPFARMATTLTSEDADDHVIWSYGGCKVDAGAPETEVVFARVAKPFDGTFSGNRSFTAGDIRRAAAVMVSDKAIGV